MAPAFHSSKTELVESLKENSRGGSEGARRDSIAQRVDGRRTRNGGGAARDRGTADSKSLSLAAGQQRFATQRMC